MQNPGGDEINRSAYKRAWLQRGGPRPGNALRYAGADGSYIEIGDTTEPVRGITREQNFDPFGQGYVTVATIETPPDFSTNQVMFKNKKGALPWLGFDQSCEFNLYQLAGFCRNPGDFSASWDQVTIFARGRLTQKARQGNVKFSEDVASITQGDATWIGGIYDVGPLYFEEEGAAVVTREIVDVTYFLSQSCGQCGPGNDGTIWRYALQQDDGASTLVLGAVVYTTDDGATYTLDPIDSLAGNDTVSAIDGMAGALIVLSDGGSAYHYAYVDAQLGTPGTWTEVTTGMANAPNDLYVASPTLAFIVADGGAIFTLRSVGQGVSTEGGLSAAALTSNNLLRVDGSRDCVVAVGASGTVLVSQNRGRSWAAAEAAIPEPADNVQAVLVIDEYLWYIGTSGGDVFYTETGGKSWETYAFVGSGAGQVTDIVGATPECLYIAHSTATPDARILATISGGAIFDLSDEGNQRRLVSVPTFDRANRLAVPKVGTLETRANHLFVGGLAGNGSDGILLHAATNVEFS